MRKINCILLISMLLCMTVKAQNFDSHFVNKTLRLDYLFTGNAKHQSICLSELIKLPNWAGRKHHLNKLPLKGNGQIIVRDSKTQQTIYTTSFSSLFQEWIMTNEAKQTSRGFENSFLVPFPKAPVDVEVVLRNAKQEVTTSFKHHINPKDVLIHEKGVNRVTPHQYLVNSGSTDKCIDVVILAEGYTKEEMSLFIKDAKIATESLFNHEPFKSNKSKFNVIAVKSESQDTNVSIPHKQLWRNTAFGSHFDTFYSERYLTTNHVKSIHDALAGIPYEHIIILANTEQYGGGGIYNSYTLTTAHHPMFKPVVVHEFGHSFGGLADEYFYDTDVMNDTYPLNMEPWEQNITTNVHFEKKWKDMIVDGTPLPTPIKDYKKYNVGLYEGAGYSSKGIYRGHHNCRMKTNEYPSFCPVCQRALLRLINFYTDDKH